MRTSKFKTLMLTVLSGWMLLPVAQADRLYLEDGSVLNGRILGLDKGEIKFATDYAGEITVRQGALTGLETDEPVVIRLNNGDEVRAILAYDSDNDWTTIHNRNFEENGLALEKLVHMRRPDQASPEELRAQEKLAELEARKAALEDPWSGRLQLGLQGSSGNTDTESNLVRAEALRDTGRERLSLSIERTKEAQDGEDTRDETRANARLERDWNERFFLFGETQAEKDEFEGVDLRLRAVVGPGYFLIREPHHEYKLRLGFGYEHVDFIEDPSESNIISTLGWDYRYDWHPWARLTHKLTVVPELDNQPTTNYRADSTFGAEFPLGGASSVWKLLAELRHEYVNEPETEDVEELDTSYLLSIIRSFR